MTTITSDLRDKIERRAKRAWRERAMRGAVRARHRITDVSDDSLLYRVPYTPDYYGKKNALVKKEQDGSVSIIIKQDPPIDCQTKYQVEKLEEHDGPVRAYKVTQENGEGHYRGGVVYKVGETVEEPNANTSKSDGCAEGINLADLAWCEKEWKPGYRIFAVEFTSDDLAAVPTGTDGKFRVFRCTVVEELDLVALGLEDPPEEEKKKKGLLGQIKDRLLGMTEEDDEDEEGLDEGLDEEEEEDDA